MGAENPTSSPEIETTPYPAVVLTSAQVRAARAAARLTTRQLAERAGVALNTVVRAESGDGPAPISAGNAAKIAGALEALGVNFLPPAGDKGGVRWSG